MNKIPLTIKELKSNTEFNYDVFTKEALISTIVSIRDYFSKSEKENKQLSNSHQIKNQQKEFIEWLEQNIENEEYCYLAQNPGERCRKDVFEEVLSKHKEIIGGKKNESNDKSAYERQNK